MTLNQATRKRLSPTWEVSPLGIGPLWTWHRFLQSNKHTEAVAPEVKMVRESRLPSLENDQGRVWLCGARPLRKMHSRKTLRKIADTTLAVEDQFQAWCFKGYAVRANLRQWDTEAVYDKQLGVITNIRSRSLSVLDP